MIIGSFNDAFSINVYFFHSTAFLYLFSVFTLSSVPAPAAVVAAVVEAAVSRDPALCSQLEFLNSAIDTSTMDYLAGVQYLILNKFYQFQVRCFVRQDP